jgi:hypothetical protein
MADHVTDSALDSIVITSQTKITLQVGANSIVIDTSGITIQCTNLTLQAEAQAQLKAAIYQEQVSGVKEASAAMCKIGS